MFAKDRCLLALLLTSGVVFAEDACTFVLLLIVCLSSISVRYATGCKPRIACLLQASMTSSAQQHEQRLAETQAEVQEATEAVQHAQAAEAEATSAADKAAASSAAAETARADANATAQRCQQAFDDSIKAIAGARQKLTTRLQQTIETHITAEVHREVLAATQQSPANWQSLQAVASEARKLLEGVDQEIRNSVDSAVRSAKAEIVSAAVEAAVAATAVQNLGASDQAGTTQVEHTQNILHLPDAWHASKALSILIKLAHLR